jgi:beta-phosphoglucomutase-like phosphatase (HAD superfamily)
VPKPARPEEPEAVLAAALARARSGAPRALVVFDLDSTLLDNRTRLARLLQDYGRVAGLPELLDARPDHFVGWSLEAALARAGLSPAQVEEHRAPARRFWAEWFFTSAYCRLDVPLPGAPAFVRQVEGTGAQVAYVSSRPPTMEAGTREVFHVHGFPIPDGRRVHLLLKPRPELSDDGWKAGAPARLDRLGAVVAAFDNEPAHVNGYARAWPAALVVHLDTDHSDRPVEILPGIPSILDFRRGGAAGA